MGRDYFVESYKGQSLHEHGGREIELGEGKREEDGGEKELGKEGERF